jgi:histidinol phosphatase-like enzyme
MADLHRPRLVVLDRDGTLIRHVHYLCDPAQVELLPGVRSGLARLREAGCKLYLHTNQSGVGRGYFPLEAALLCNDEMIRQLGLGLEVFEDICVCPEAPGDASPEGDIEIAVTGLRPGEKLYEELLIGDNPKPTVHSRIMKAHEEFIPWAEFEAKLTALEMALNVNDVGLIRLMMQQLMAGYIPSDDIVDWVYLEQEAEAQALGLA